MDISESGARGGEDGVTQDNPYQKNEEKRQVSILQFAFFQIEKIRILLYRIKPADRAYDSIGINYGQNSY